VTPIDVERSERLGDGLQGMIVGAGESRGVGVLVLAGSSGRVDVDRARALARYGAVALALRWFGGSGQSPGICEVPLESFTAGIDRLVEEGASRIGIVGLSKGAEAALLVACLDPRVRSVVAISPSSVSWANVGPGRDGRAYPYRSSWTWRSEPLPFVPYAESWRPGSDGPVAYRSLYEASLLAFSGARTAAAIPVEQAEADVVLVAGADDQLWPSDTFAEELASRRRASRRQVELIVDPEAGHRPVFPGEPAPEPSTSVVHGGSPAADERVGRSAWPSVLAQLGLA
jgi:dienelactone hydrolase